MKKLKFLCMLLLVAISFAGCQKKESSGITTDELLAEFKQTTKFNNELEEDLLDIGVAERYGITIDSIHEGKVYSDSSDENTDKIIIVRAKDDDSIPKIESALASEKIRLSDAWENDEEQRKKLEKSIIKTRGNMIIMIVSDRSTDIKRVFDKLV